MTKLNAENIEIILSALEFDKVGKWGDGRQEKIDRAIKKIKTIKKEARND